jgi:transposase
VKEWCIPEASAAFVANMENVLDVYERPYNPLEPVVCFDESTKQLIADVRTPVPMQPGQVARQDSEYQRNGTANLFMYFEPLRGWRHVTLSDRRTRQDFAHQIRFLVDTVYPHATCIHLVLDNLNTHSLASLYETFSPAEANRLSRRLTFHFTPKHGSWLNMAEIEFSVLSRLALDQRIPTLSTLNRIVGCWEASRNAKGASVNWRFTAQDARIKLARLYPSIPA